jgi:hypothetical protein
MFSRTADDIQKEKLGEGLTARYEILRRASELVGSCEHDTEASGSMKGGELLD